MALAALPYEASAPRMPRPDSSKMAVRSRKMDRWIRRGASFAGTGPASALQATRSCRSCVTANWAWPPLVESLRELTHVDGGVAPKEVERLSEVRQALGV
jgi:hypothetical protein